MRTVHAFGEVIASSLTQLTVQAWELEQYPPFGSLIRTHYEKMDCFGIVCDIQTGPKDAARTPLAFGKTVQELKQEQPHIFQLLHTIVTVLPLGYTHKTDIVYAIPPCPAPIHSFAYACASKELMLFFSNMQWLITFFNLAQQNPLFDELLLALLHNAHRSEALNNKIMQEIIDTFCLLTHNDYWKLKIFLQRIESFIY